MRLNLTYGKHAQLDAWWQYPLRDLRTLYRVVRFVPYYVAALLTIVAGLGFLLALAAAG